MRFFQQFPTLSYRQTEVTANNELMVVERVVPNMTVKLRLDVLSDETVPYVTYRLKDRDRPDTIAAEMYGGAQYAWVVMLANNMRDWYDWPLTDEEFSYYLAAKYESAPGVGDGATRAARLVKEYVWNHTMYSAGTNPPDTQTLVTQRILTDDSFGGLKKVTAGRLIINAGSQVVTGNGTAFLTTANVGDTILIGTAYNTDAVLRTITAVTNNTALVVNEAVGSIPSHDGDGPEYSILANTIPITAVEVVTVYEDEYQQNDAKRTIRLVATEALPQLLEQFRNVVAQ